MKKNGKNIIVTGLISVSIFFWYKNYKKTKEIFYIPNRLTIENYVNRLKEYDISSEKEASNLFFDLIECGFSPQRAFDTVQKEINDSGEHYQ